MDEPTPHTLTAKQIAQALGKTARTVKRWPARGCPHSRLGAQYFFNLEGVVAWRAGARESPTSETSASNSPTSAESLRRAELARRLTLARRNELELEAESKLRELKLDEKIRAAKTHDAMLEVSSEVCALIGSGSLSPARGRAIQTLLAEMRRSLKEHLEREPDKEGERIVLLTPEGMELVEAFEGIVSDERRARILDRVAKEREIDEVENPNVDLAAFPPLGTDDPELDLVEEEPQ